MSALMMQVNIWHGQERILSAMTTCFGVGILPDPRMDVEEKVMTLVMGTKDCVG